MNENTSKRKISALNIVGIVLLVIFLPLIIINMTLVIKGALNKDRIPTVFNKAPLIIVSDSMTIGYYTTDPNYNGAFNKNDLIIIKKVDATKLEVGDIATYIAGDGSVINHRVIRKTTNEKNEVRYIMKGDNSPSEDPDLITPEQIQGVYVKRFAGLGGFAMKLREPIGIILLILIPAAIFFAVYFVQKQLENKKNEESKAQLEAELEELRKEKAAREETDNN